MSPAGSLPQRTAGDEVIGQATPDMGYRTWGTYGLLFSRSRAAGEADAKGRPDSPVTEGGFERMARFGREAGRTPFCRRHRIFPGCLWICERMPRS
jgi:hypothetical protein